jgi:hypothetical protein
LKLVALLAAPDAWPSLDAGDAARMQAGLGMHIQEVFRPGGKDFDAESARVWRVLTSWERLQARSLLLHDLSVALQWN